MNNKDISAHIISLTKRLMAIDSTYDNGESLHAALNIIEEELDGEFPIQKFVSNGIPSILVSNTNDEKKHFKIILNAHLDVAPAAPEDFTPIEKDGKLHGRGAYDMKAAAAAMVYAFKTAAKNISYPIALQVVTDEEVGGINGVAYQIEQGIRGDFVIIGDCGSNLQIINQAKGIVWMKLHATGIKAHGAYLWRGRNALHELQKALASLHEIFPLPESDRWVDTMNLAKIETSNNAFNHVPDDARAYLDFRFTHGDKDAMIKRIKSAIPADIEIEVIFGNAPEYVSPDNQYVLQLQKVTKDILGKKAELQGAHAPSDLRHFNEVGCQGVQFGTIGDHQHGDEEWVDLQSVADYYAILKDFLLMQH